MTPDGISTEDWERVYEASVEIVDATAMDDDVLVEHRCGKLSELLDELQVLYGRLPSILATRADLVEDEITAIALHEEVLVLAKDPLTKCLSLQSLVQLLIDQRADSAVIAKRLSELEAVTDSENEEELEELRKEFGGYQKGA